MSLQPDPDWLPEDTEFKQQAAAMLQCAIAPASFAGLKLRCQIANPQFAIRNPQSAIT